MCYEAVKFATSYKKNKVKYAEIGKAVSKILHRNLKTCIQNI